MKHKKEYLNDHETNQNENIKRKFKNETGQQLDGQVYESFVQQRWKFVIKVFRYELYTWNEWISEHITGFSCKTNV